MSYQNLESGITKSVFKYVLVVAVAAFIGYEFAYLQSDLAKKQEAQASQSLKNALAENRHLNESLNKLKIQLDVQSLANENIQQELASSIEEKAELRQQISFYQRVMAPESSQDGFVVERIEVQPTQSKNNYSVKLMLLQHQNIKAVIKGELDITLRGSQNGSPKVYNINDLRVEKDQPLNFAFRYFQVVEMSITLPEGFVPERFDIATDVYKYRKKRGSYAANFSWQEAYAQDT